MAVLLSFTLFNVGCTTAYKVENKNVATVGRKIDMAAMELIAYAHGEYFDVTDPAGFFGWSVRRKKVIKREMRKG